MLQDQISETKRFCAAINDAKGLYFINAQRKRP